MVAKLFFAGLNMYLLSLWKEDQIVRKVSFQSCQWQSQIQRKSENLKLSANAVVSVKIHKYY